MMAWVVVETVLCDEEDAAERQVVQLGPRWESGRDGEGMVLWCWMNREIVIGETMGLVPG